MTALRSYLARHAVAGLAAPMLLPLVAFGCFVGGQELGYRMLGVPTGPDTSGTAVMEVRPAAPSAPVALLDRHGCWSAGDDRPDDVALPGHAVVTVGGTTRYAGPRLTGLALEQELGGVDHGLLVHGFCR